MEQTNPLFEFLGSSSEFIKRYQEGKKLKALGWTVILLIPPLLSLVKLYSSPQFIEKYEIGFSFAPLAVGFLWAVIKIWLDFREFRSHEEAERKRQNFMQAVRPLVGVMKHAQTQLPQFFDLAPKN